MKMIFSFSRFFTILTMLFVGLGSIWAAEVSYVMKSYDSTNKVYTAKDDQNGVWSLSKSCSTSNQLPADWSKTDASSRGICFSTPDNVTVTSQTNFSNITKIVVEASSNIGSGTGTIAIKVGETSLGSKNLSKTNHATYEYTSATPVSGKIVLTVNQGANSVWIGGFKVTTQSGDLYSISIDSEIQNGTVDANPKSAESGTVITLKATPAPGYKFGSWNVTNTSTSEEIEVTENKFTMPAANVNVSATFAAISKHIAHFSINGEIDANNDKEVYEGAAITFPEEPADILGKKFQGWTKIAVYSSATTAPSDLCKAADMGTGDVTFYAVYADRGEGGEEWQKVTAVSQVVAGTYAMITFDGAYFLPNTSTTSAPTATAVTVVDEKIKVLAKMKWTLIISDNKYIFEGATPGNYLWGAPTNDGIRITDSSAKSNPFKEWVLESNATYGLIIKDAGTTGRILSTNGTTDWRNYTTVTATNRAANLYKLVAGTIFTNYTTTVTTSYTREDLTVGDYGTICLPYASAGVEGAVMYSIVGTIANGGIEISPIEGQMAAGTPYIFRATASTLTVTYTGEAADVQQANEANGLVGNLGEEKVIEQEQGYCVIYNNKVCPVGSDVKVGKNRAYIDYESISTVPAPSRIVMPGIVPVPTDIENHALNVEVKKVVVDGQMMIIRGGNMFDLNGRLVK